MIRPRRIFRAALAILALGLVVLALARILANQYGVETTRMAVEGTPATIFRSPGGPPRPVVAIAHGFAGSQQLMRSFALTLARNGYVAVTFDFPGHGRNPDPLTGSVTDTHGATRTLLDDLASVVTATRGLGDGRLAVLGHSMASDIVVRYAEAHPDVSATVAVSMFSPAVTASAPRDLLVIVGAWESMLTREALRVVGLATAPATAEPGVTYGDMAAGTARRAAVSAHVEHASVLYSQDSLREALAWLDQAFETTRAAPPVLDDSGPWILLLIAAIVLLAWPLSTLLPSLATPPLGAGLGWRKLALPLLVPMVAVPLLLRILPTHFLPVLVGDYLAAHFALYGLVTALCLGIQRGVALPVPMRLRHPISFLAAVAAVVAFGFVALVWPIDAFVTSFVPGPARAALIAAMLVGTLAFFLSDEWTTRVMEPAVAPMRPRNSRS